MTAETAVILSDYDLILDGSDNFDTRYLVNRLAAKAGKPLISAAITQWEGQISVCMIRPMEPLVTNAFSRTAPRPAWCRPVPRPGWRRLCRG